MAMAYESQSAAYTAALDGSNVMFTLVFLLEAILKITAYGNTYLQTSWNKFDFFVVVASILDYGLEYLQKSGVGSELGFLSLAP